MFAVKQDNVGGRLDAVVDEANCGTSIRGGGHGAELNLVGLLFHHFLGDDGCLGIRLRTEHLGGHGTEGLSLDDEVVGRTILGRHCQGKGREKEEGQCGELAGHGVSRVLRMAAASVACRMASRLAGARRAVRTAVMKVM